MLTNQSDLKDLEAFARRLVAATRGKIRVCLGFVPGMTNGAQDYAPGDAQTARATPMLNGAQEMYVS